MSSGLFHALKPTCCLVLSDPSIINLTKAKLLFESLENNSINDQTLFNYCVFPFEHCLKKGIREKHNILCFQCLQAIISKCLATVLECDVVLWFLKLISLEFKNADSKTEEKSISITDALISLFSKLPNDTMLHIYAERNLPMIGHVVSVLLNFIEKERYRKLQLTSMECLQLLAGSKHHVNEDVIGSMMASFFPGISLTMKRFFLHPTNQKKKLIQSALDTFSFIVCLVLKDKDKERQVKLDEEILVAENNEQKNSLKVNRTSDWLKRTAENLLLIFQNIFPVLVCHLHSSVRLSLLNFVRRVLMACMENLKDSVPYLIALLSQLSCDEHEQIRAKSEKLFFEACQQFERKDSKKLREVLDEKWYCEVLAMPRVVRGVVNDDMKLVKLQMLEGYLKFYGHRLKQLLCTYIHAEKLINAILQILEMDIKYVNMVKERTSITPYLSLENISPNPLLNSKHFKHFKDSRILQCIQNIVTLMAVNGDVNLWVDCLLECVTQSTMHRLQAVLMINLIFDRSTDRRERVVSSTIKQVLSTYLQDEWWLLPTNNDHIPVHLHDDDGVSLSCFLAIPLDTLNANIQLLCLLLEGLGVFARVLGKEFYLLDALYAVLEKVGSGNERVSQTAYHTLQLMAEHCNCSDISGLILDNSDYLINSITLKFRHYGRDSPASVVLCVIIKYADISMLSIVADSCEDVYNTLDVYKEEVAVDMLEVLLRFVQAVEQLHTNNNRVKCPVQFSKSDSLDVHCEDVSVSEFFSSYARTVLCAFGEGAEEENVEREDEAKSSENVDNCKGEIPLHYKVVITALKKCVYYITSRENCIKLKALFVTLHALNALRHREDDLLPCIHELWPPIRRTFKYADELVTLRCLDVVSAMVEHSGDFMYVRLVTEFIPLAVEYLKKQETCFTSSQSKYTKTSKALVKLIQFLGEVVPALAVSKECFCQLCTSVAAYLSEHLHSIVQREALSTLRKWREHKPCIVWLLCCRVRVNPPHSSLLEFIPLGLPFDEDLCKENLQHLCEDNINDKS